MRIRHCHGLIVGGRERDREGEQASLAVYLPSFMVTSLMLMRGSSSTMVPTPWPSAMVALVRVAQVDEEGLVRLGERGRRLTSTVIVLLVWPAGIVSVPVAAW